MPLNGTRIAASHDLFLSVLRMSKALRIYFDAQDGPTRGIMLTDEEIADALVFEAILYIVSKTTTLAQDEHLFNGAILVLIKIMTLRALRADQRACARARSLPPCSAPALVLTRLQHTPRRVRKLVCAKCRASISTRR